MVITIPEKKTQESFIERRARILYVLSVTALIVIVAFSYHWSALEVRLADGQATAEMDTEETGAEKITPTVNGGEIGNEIVDRHAAYDSQKEREPRDELDIDDAIPTSSPGDDAVTSIGDIDVCSSDLVKIKRQTLPFLEDADQMQSFDDHFVYRAYYDNRPSLKPTVHIISVLPRNETTVLCYAYTRNANGTARMVFTRGQYWSIHNMQSKSEVHSAFLNCALPDRDLKPEFVVLTTEKCGSPVAALAVHNIHQQTKKYNFTVCLHQALFNVRMSSMPRLLEWLAVNRVFGADRFVIYYLKSTKHIASYLRPLEEIGLVETHLWDYNRDGRHIEDFHGQKALINDCIYRFMYTADRILLLDFDEYPTPQLQPNWSTMLANSPCANAASVYFLNSFFPLDIVNNAEGANYKLNVLLKDKKQDFFHRCGKRSKLLVHPPDILASSIHKLYRLAEEKTRKDECCLPINMGYLHHYRRMKGETDTVIDNRMRKFQTEIEASVKEIYTVLDRSTKELDVRR